MSIKALLARDWQSMCEKQARAKHTASPEELLSHADRYRQLAEEIDRLSDALQRAARWGMNGAGYDARAATELEDWVKGGMKGVLPPLEPHRQH